MSSIIRQKPTLSTWGILALSIVLTALGQLFMKVSAQYLTSWEQVRDYLFFWQLAADERSFVIWLALGLMSYFCSMLLLIYVLSFLKLSRIYPLLSIAYVLVYLGAVLWPRIDEDVSLEKNIGVIIIIIGGIVVSIPSKKALPK